MEGSMVLFGCPEEGERFRKRNEVFFSFWPRLEGLLNRVFSRKFETEEPADQVVFRLGRVAVEDFLELLLLASNGYGYGAMKLLRSCYELTITCGYLAKHPEELEAFLEFRHVSSRRALHHFKSLGFDPSFRDEKIAEIESEFERVKAKFTENVCTTCGKTRIQASWSKLDMLSMAREIGVEKVYVMGYFWPTMQSHATTYRLMSHFIETADGARFQAGPQPEQADAALAFAFLAMALLVDVQDHHFGLGLREELEALLTDYNKALQTERSP
jgi:Family of unknown function (DUF5677)